MTLQTYDELFQGYIRTKQPFVYIPLNLSQSINEMSKYMSFRKVFIVGIITGSRFEVSFSSRLHEVSN